MGEGNTYPTKCAGDDRGGEKERETPLELEALVVHADEIDAATEKGQLG